MHARFTIAIFLIATYAYPAWSATTFDEIKREFRPSDTLVLDRDGEAIQRLRTDTSVRRGQWVALADISPALRTALVLSEDKRFYEHSGVDWRAVSSAAWANLWNTKTRGASTLSMQLAGLLDTDLRAGTGGRSITQKIGQTFSAQLLEQRWRKDQILEAYLNLVPFRGELVGIDALSRTLFGKAAHGLNEREAALAAALVRAPNAKATQVAQRACGVLQLMQPGAKIDCDGLDLFATGALQRRAFEASEGIAPHAARQRELGGTVGPGGAEAARGEGKHAQREVAAVAEPLDPRMLLQDAEHRAQRVGARGPHQFVGRGVDAARDVAGEEREQRVVEVVDRRDQPDRPGHPRHGREAVRLPGEGRCVHDAGRSARRCARASSTGSPASRRST